MKLVIYLSLLWWAALVMLALCKARSKPCPKPDDLKDSYFWPVVGLKATGQDLAVKPMPNNAGTGQQTSSEISAAVEDDKGANNTTPLSSSLPSQPSGHWQHGGMRSAAQVVITSPLETEGSSASEGVLIPARHLETLCDWCAREQAIASHPNQSHGICKRHLEQMKAEILRMKMTAA